MIKEESPNILNFFTPNAKAVSRPTTHASYSAALLVTSKSSFIEIGTCSSLGDTSSTPTPHPFWFEAPSKYKVQVSSSVTIKSSSGNSLSCIGVESSIGKSARKSDTTDPLITFFGMNLTSNWAKLTIHLDMRPLSVDFSNKYLSGSNRETTKTVCTSM